MKRFKVEHKDLLTEDKPDIIVTLNKPPYRKKDILKHTGWKAKDVTITDITPTFEGEE